MPIIDDGTWPENGKVLFEGTINGYKNIIFDAVIQDGTHYAGVARYADRVFWRYDDEQQRIVKFTSTESGFVTELIRQTGLNITGRSSTTFDETMEKEDITGKVIPA